MRKDMKQREREREMRVVASDEIYKETEGGRDEIGEREVGDERDLSEKVEK